MQQGLCRLVAAICLAVSSSRTCQGLASGNTRTKRMAASKSWGPQFGGYGLQYKVTMLETPQGNDGPGTMEGETGFGGGGGGTIPWGAHI